MMRLEIYVAHAYANCEEALLIAERARGIAGLEVAVIDLDTPGQHVPPACRRCADVPAQWQDRVPGESQTRGVPR